MKAVRVGNRLVSSLSPGDRKRLLANCKEVELIVGDILQEPGGRIRYVYFPVAGMISLLVPVVGRGNLEVSLVGTEGFLGIPTVLGVDVSPLQGLVQGSGAALRIPAQHFRQALESSRPLRRTISRYAYVLMAQLAESPACVKFHLLEARLARWLLMTHDRSVSNELRLTHEFLAQMLGVRRVGVTNAAGLLQKRHLISYARGKITILNRAGLESASCSCYQIGEDIYERTLG